MSLPQLLTLHAQKVFRLLCRWNHLVQTLLKESQHFMVGALRPKLLQIVQE
jgi:hypothetical protein